MKGIHCYYIPSFTVILSLGQPSNQNMKFFLLFRAAWYSTICTPIVNTYITLWTQKFIPNFCYRSTVMKNPCMYI